LRFFFTHTIDRPDLTRKLIRVAHPRNLPVVLSRDEVTRLLNATTCLKHQAALSVAYGAGLRVAEVAALKVTDIDSERMLLRVEPIAELPRPRMRSFSQWPGAARSTAPRRTLADHDLGRDKVLPRPCARALGILYRRASSVARSAIKTPFETA
jgi:integrase